MDTIIHQDVIGSMDNNNKSNSFGASWFGDSAFVRAFVASLAMIVVSELGDKTFFIAAIMAMRHPRMIVFGGAIGALALMTILSGTKHKQMKYPWTEPYRIMIHVFAY